MSQPASPSPAAGTPAPSASQTAAQQRPRRRRRRRSPHRRLLPQRHLRLPPAEAIAPSFDIVRVEPNGDSVIAGRSAPGATIELLRNDQVHARAVADNSGLFAFTPPPLPSGSHKIVLQSIAPDGKRQRSKESVTVEINGSTRPLVALTAPDKPTVAPLQSRAGAPPKAAEALPRHHPRRSSRQAPANGAHPPRRRLRPPAPRAEIKIMSVESEEGKLYVSGEAAPGATVRLYLNESFIAPGGAGGDGKLSFAIASGVKPGEYRVRLDDVDPVSGQVKSRAEVGYNVPALVAEAAPPAPTALRRPRPGRLRPRRRPRAPAAWRRRRPARGTAAQHGGDSQYRHRHRVAGRQPVAHQPADLWPRLPLHGRSTAPTRPRSAIRT